MNCNNKHCVFNAFNQCCHEDEIGMSLAKPNRLDCPSSIRSDIQFNLISGIEEIMEKSQKLNHKEVSVVLNLINKLQSEKESRRANGG